jgi:hypothetical protein
MSVEAIGYDAACRGAEVHAKGDARRSAMLDRARDGADQATPDDLLPVLGELPATATLRDLIEVVLGERPIGHSQTYANVLLTQRALARLAEVATGRKVAPWELAP